MGKFLHLFTKKNWIVRYQYLFVNKCSTGDSGSETFGFSCYVTVDCNNSAQKLVAIGQSLYFYNFFSDNKNCVC